MRRLPLSTSVYYKMGTACACVIYKFSRDIGIYGLSRSTAIGSVTQGKCRESKHNKVHEEEGVVSNRAQNTAVVHLFLIVCLV